ncbi:MAG TPA: hypothetical protein VGC04_07765 [Cellulomonas sp.]
MSEPTATPGDDAARWREERRAAADHHAQALARRQAAEAAQARELLRGLVERAETAGPAPEPLVVRSFDGRHTYRTALRGWYLRQDRSVAVDTDGEFYVLRAPSSLAALWRGVRPQPSDPPLVLGAGGKDGESLDLEVAIARVLAAGGER